MQKYVDIKENQELEKALDPKRITDPIGAKINDLLEELNESEETHNLAHILEKIRNEPGAGYKTIDINEYEIEKFRNFKNAIYTTNAINDVQNLFDQMVEKLNGKLLISFLINSADPAKNNQYSLVANSKYINKIANAFIGGEENKTFTTLITGSENIAKVNMQKISNLDTTNTEKNKKKNKTCGGCYII